MNKPYKIYGQEYIDPKAINQFFNALECDFAVRGALMPDAHYGYALPIGGVVSTRNTVVPAWVGYDIGCGMCAVKTSFLEQEIRDNSEKIFHQIYRDIPVGFKHNKESVDWDKTGMKCSKWFYDMYKNHGGDRQLGTLGSGNHFIEIGKANTDGSIWIIIHSGSRNVGHKTAQNYMKLASNSNKAKEGHYGLHVDSEIGRDYIMDMNFCLAFALRNRMVMMDRVCRAINHCGVNGGWSDLDSLINRNHNHAEKLELDEFEMWIHRKGATHAEEGMYGVIPGNMRDGSFIVRGKGCEGSLFSSSHGAGRILSRREAHEKVDMDEFSSSMEGITAKVTEQTRDESPVAYKHIETVMGYQRDLVEILDHVKPIINIKG